MYCAPTFTCLVEMISNFPIIYTFRKLFKDPSTTNITYFCILLHLDVILVLLLLSVTFCSFLHQLYFSCVLLKIHKTFSYSLFHDLKYVFFLCDKIPKLLTLNIHKEYAPENLLLKNFLEYLHIHLFFSIKDSISA